MYSVRVRTCKVQTGFYSHQLHAMAFVICGGVKVSEWASDGPERTEVLTDAQVKELENRAISGGIDRAEEIRRVMLEPAIKVLQDEDAMMQKNSGASVYSPWIQRLITRMRNAYTCRPSDSQPSLQS